MKNSFILATLSLLGSAMSSPVALAQRDTSASLPDSIPDPGPGQCAVICMAGVDATITGTKRGEAGDSSDLGGDDTSGSSPQASLSDTGPWIGVVGGQKEWVMGPGAFDDEKSGYGWQTTLNWNGDTLVWDAPYIGYDETDWDVTYTVDGTYYDCSGNECQHY